MLIFLKKKKEKEKEKIRAGGSNMRMGETNKDQRRTP
uniref:Uncharacterized protein n=1 Tax=Anguilla anguilla TaxID=7936 RepID=A0A0E9PAU3_ANGAN